MTDFSLQKHTVANGHICQTKIGFPFAQIRYILSGSCLMPKSSTKPHEEGSLIFIPHNTPYEICWRGEPEAEYYVLEFAPDLLSAEKQYARSADSPALGETFKKLSESISAGTKLESLTLFCLLLSTCEKNLKKQTDVQKASIYPAVRYINTHLSEEWSVGTLAKMCCLSESRFYCLFKQQTGMSPICYKNTLKIEKASFLLKEGFTAEEICEHLNFCSVSFFRRTFKSIVGSTPKQYMKSFD